ncbi:hypothetical protein Psfp_04254 [Pelotomaculum sp. FP]|nr:hypothetical protein Psfp_04254 [Pelotomaculum sp. FP]
MQDGINSIFEKSAVGARNEGLKNADEMGKAMVSVYPGSPNKCETYFDYRLKYIKTEKNKHIINREFSLHVEIITIMEKLYLYGYFFIA